MNICKLIILSITLIANESFADETVPTFQLLSERRESIKFPVYTVEQKKLVLDQVRLVMNEIFVHRELKLKDFGVDSDPLPLLNALERKLSTISDYDFHKTMAEIFAKQKDFHTSYTFPKPYSCYRSFIPISFKEVEDLGGNKVIAVSEISDSEEVMQLMPSNFRTEVGDIVLTYNGLPVRQAMAEMESISRGANPAAILRHTANLLTYIGHNTDVVPEKNSTTLVLKSRLGKTYSTTIPWVSRANATCLEDKKTESSTLAKIGANEYQNEFNKLFRKTNKSKSLADADGLKETSEPILKYKKISNEYGNYGYFKLESFEPEKLSIDGVIAEFRKILQREFAHTTGIIIDLRDNGGGLIDLADGLVQLFTAKNITPMNFRQKSSPANLFYMQKVEPEGSFTKSLEQAAQNNAVYSDLFPIDAHSSESANRIGQYFFRPVAILTNSNCYSSCDMFSAHMQDQAGAVIYGEDANTGAGGANNYNLNGLFGDLPADDKGPFKALPGDQNIGFSIRQTIRVGARAGALIEDIGIEADFLAFPKLSDLYNGSANQIRTLSEKLNVNSKDYQSWVVIKNDPRQDILIHQKPDLFVTWAQTDSILYKNKGKVIGEVAVELDNFSGRLLDSPEVLTLNDYKIDQFELIGMDGKKRAWRKMINYRSIPSSFIIPDNQGLGIDLNNPLPDFFALYTLKVPKSDGWVQENNTLKIGSGDSYNLNVYAEAAFFVTLPNQKLKLSFDASIATELNYDFLKVVVASEGKEATLLNTSGSIPMQNYTYDLSAYAGKKIEVRFLFTSDTYYNDAGVVLKNIKIEN